MDPEHQFASSYKANGNNPLNQGDPTWGYCPNPNWYYSEETGLIFDLNVTGFQKGFQYIASNDASLEEVRSTCNWLYSGNAVSIGYLWNLLYDGISQLSSPNLDFTHGVYQSEEALASITISMPLGGIGIAGMGKLVAEAVPPIVVGLLAAYGADVLERRLSDKTYGTYTKINPSTGQIYIGRTYGYRDPTSIVARRDYRHIA